MKTRCIATLGTLTYFYLFGVFVENTFDISEWSGFTRLLIAILGTGIAAIVATCPFKAEA